jgi:ABC-type polysaccharide/polyol phosphate export permease
VTSGFEAHVVQNRRLIWAFVQRELRSRYAGSFLGVFWSIIHPVVLLLLYILVFSSLTRGVNVTVGGRVAGYAVFLCPAVLAWNWLHESLVASCTSISGNATLVKKVVFPVAILPLVSILVGIIPYVVAITVFMVFLAFMGGFSAMTLLLLPPVILLQILFLIGPAYILASLNVFVRDTAQFVLAAMQFLFWGTPIVYSAETLEKPFPWIKWWFDLNPIHHLMEAYRAVIISSTLPAPGSIIYLLILSIVSYQAGKVLFIRGRRHFPDEV